MHTYSHKNVDPCPELRAALEALTLLVVCAVIGVGAWYGALAWVLR